MEKLKAIRFYKGLRQWDLAIKTGISQTTISLIENGYTKPTERQKEILAAALEESPDELFPSCEGVS